MAEFASPLRYPGGKAALADFLSDLIIANDLHDGVYVEPFAGGAGAAIELLKREVVSKILINDLDFPIYAFWKSAIEETERFVERLMTVPITIREWEKAREVYRAADRRRVFETGFSTFFLNRCNRSGIIAGAGPIGGFEQEGNYKIDARFNRVGLAHRFRVLQRYADCITITNMDGLALLRRPPKIMKGAFVYLDPPYVHKGPQLYLRAFEESCHNNLAKLLHKPTPFRWVLTYDDAPIIRKLYAQSRKCLLSLGYSAASRGQGSEWLIFDDSLKVTPLLLSNHRANGKVKVASKFSRQLARSA
jgi:DNA adenine methylase